MNTTTRRSALAALAATAAAVTVGTAEAEARPVVNAWDHLARRVAAIRVRLTLHRQGEAPEVRDLRRQVKDLTRAVEDLVALTNPRSQEPRP